MNSYFRFNWNNPAKALPRLLFVVAYVFIINNKYYIYIPSTEMSLSARVVFAPACPWQSVSYIC